jgi:hypothetical protein
LIADQDRILIYRLAAGELDAAEEERVRARVARQPELAALLEELRDLQARVSAAFPNPPAPRDPSAFVELMQRLSSGEPEPREGVRASRSAALPSAVADFLRDSPAAGPRLGLTSGRGRSQTRGALRSLRSRLAEVRARARDSGGRSRLRREPEAQAHLFHLREIPREVGFPLELELYAGDLLALRSEVLLVSAFAGSYLPTPGSVFGAIADRFGIAFEAGPPPGTTSHPGGLLRFSGISCPAFDSLWVLEMQHPGETFSREDLRNALEVIGRALPEMLSGASSITLPLLGTGSQQVDPTWVARELLSAVSRWASTPGLETVRVVTLEMEHVAILNRALDDRDFGVANSAFHLACRELADALEHAAWSEPVRGTLKDLLQIATSDAPSLTSIALEGRRVAETVLRELARGEEGEGALSAETDASNRRRADFAEPSLQLLLQYGSADAGEIAAQDAVMILYAAMRAAEATGE